MLTVQCDFDETIATSNVSFLLLEAFGREGWRSVQTLYDAGQISVEENNRRQFALLNADGAAITDFVIANVEVRPGFPQFVDYCLESGIHFTVVSNGIDFYVLPVMRNLGLSGVEVHCGRSQITPNGVVLSYPEPSGSDCLQGFKLSWLRHHKSRRRSVVYIGDGKSDIPAASEADYVIARSTLYSHFQSSGLPCSEFQDFFDVRKAVEHIASNQPTP